MFLFVDFVGGIHCEATWVTYQTKWDLINKLAVLLNV